MRGAVLQAQTLTALGRGEHGAPLVREGGESTRERAVPCATDLEDVRGFLARRNPAKGGQTQGATSRILRLAAPVVLGHPAQGGHRIGTDRHADVIEPSGRGGCELRGESGGTRSTDGGRG